MELYKIETGNFMLDGGALFGVVPKSIWEKRYPVNNDNLCNICMRCLLIKEGERLILIDCGLGNTMNESLLKYYFLNGSDTLLNSLAAHGVAASDITDVVLSHLHFDHCGGATTKQPNESLELTFKNACYWIGKTHWESALQPNRRERPSFLKENIEPLAASGKLNLIEHETEIAPGVNLRLFNGHTLGQIIPFIKFKNKTLVYCADLIPIAALLPISFVCGYDIYPIVTMEETEVFLNEVAENNYTLFFEHDLYTECCSVEKTAKGVMLKESFTLTEFIENR